jgi:hypothetical protein
MMNNVPQHGAIRWPARGHDETISPGEQLLKRTGFALLCVSAILVALLTSFHLPLDAPWTDLFHEGEYLSPRLYFDTPGASPLLIHGQMDYLPAQLAASHCPGSELVCTRAINGGLTTLAGVLFFLCAVVAVVRGRSQAFAGIAALAILVAINGTRDNLVGLHQGSPSVRDVGLLGTILFLLLASRREGRVGLALALLSGLVAGATAFFSYNRGLVGVLAIIVYVVATVIAGKNRYKSLAAAAGTSIGLALATLPDLGMGRTHIVNIFYWSQHPEIWTYGASLSRKIRAAAFFIPVISLIIGAMWIGYKSWRRERNSESVPILAVLIAICVLMLQQTTQLYDGTHLSFNVPWVFLLGIVLTNRLPAAPHGFAARPVIAAGCVALLLMLGNGSPILKALAGASVHNLRMIRGREMPKDEALVGPDVHAAAELLRHANPACTYALNNAAGLYELSSRKPCSSLMMPAYASGGGEAQLIADLSRTRPPVIVSHTGDGIVILGRGLEARNPRLAGWVAANYPSTFKIGNIELRSRVPLTKAE